MIEKADQRGTEIIESKETPMRTWLAWPFKVCGTIASEVLPAPRKEAL